MLNDITSLLGLVWGLSAAQMLCTLQLLLHLWALEMRSDHRLGRVNASLGVLVPHFSGTQTDLSREACLLFGLLMLSPEVMLVYCTNQTIGFPPDPSLWVVLKPDDICRCLPVCLLPDLGAPPSWSGSIQFNSTTIYRALLWPGAALTLEIDSWPPSSLLFNLVPAAPLIRKAPEGAEGWSCTMNSRPSLGGLGSAPYSPRALASPL